MKAKKVQSDRGLRHSPFPSKLLDSNNEETHENHVVQSDDEFEDIDEESVDNDFVYKDLADPTASYDDDIVNEHEESLVKMFLHSNVTQSRTLADIIMEKIREKEQDDETSAPIDVSSVDIPPKVIEVYTGVGDLLQHFKSGKLPKALKMLPHLKNWEKIMWITRPDLWSPAGTFVVTRIFTSNLNAKLAQRFLNLVLLEKCRDDIRNYSKLNFHLYMALKKALFKPAAFYKGIMLPLVLSGTCTLREACIFGSVISKVSIPSIHSAAALLRLIEIPYTGATSVFVKILLSKKYAFPRRVIDGLISHFCSFIEEERALPVIWHQSLLCFVQRYKFEFDDKQIESILILLKKHSHTAISVEIKRELIAARNQQ